MTAQEEDEEKQALKRRVAEMEEDAKRRTEESSRKLRALQQQHEQFTSRLQDRIKELEDQTKALSSRAAAAKRKPKRRQAPSHAEPAHAPVSAPPPASATSATAGQDRGLDSSARGPSPEPSGGEHAARQATHAAREAAEAEAEAARVSLADLRRGVVERCLAFAVAQDLTLDQADPNDASATLEATLDACERVLRRQSEEAGAQEARGVTEAKADAAGKLRELVRVGFGIMCRSRLRKGSCVLTPATLLAGGRAVAGVDADSGRTAAGGGGRVPSGKAGEPVRRAARAL